LLGPVLDFGLLFVSVAGATHALLYKRDPRASLGWMVACLALPGVGTLLYAAFGVNLVRTRGRRLRRRWPFFPTPLVEDVPEEVEEAAALPPPGVGRRDLDPREKDLARIGERVARLPLLPGNAVEPLVNGEEAYPAMLEAIATATERVFLCTYIFETNDTGRRFVEALAAAGRRGVDVRVLVDGVGEHYSRPRAARLLADAPGVQVERFLPPSLLRPHRTLNLRNHRKILAVDGRVAFTGGMNLGGRHMLTTDGRRRVADVHFRVRGPVVAQVEQAFLEDWHFARDLPPPEAPLSMPRRVGTAWCRGLREGPNEDLDRLHWIMAGVFAAARERIRVMTPYFIPDDILKAALNAAALRGVEVQVVLPEHSNLPVVDWASRAMLWELLKYDVEIWLQPPPFAHTKLLRVDQSYCQVGSANLDPRSLRLNFEFNLEILDQGLAARLDEHFDAVLARSRRLTLAEVDARSLPVRLRDSLARLFSPYL